MFIYLVIYLITHMTIQQECTRAKYKHGLKHQGVHTYKCSNTQSVLTLFMLISTNIITNRCQHRKLKTH